jgi:DNA-binding transcriptional LysR family regulator
MRGNQFAKLSAFMAVADHGNFTRAAAFLGIATPSLSLAIRSLEQELGVRLLNRTTRSVALTEAGERLLAQLHPLMDAFDQAVDSIHALHDKPVGTLRLAVSRFAALTLVSPLTTAFLAEYPGIDIEVCVDSSHTDIVGDRFDAGIRVGGRIERDMIAVRIGGDFRMAAAAAPDYLAKHPPIRTPEDLGAHNCIRYRTDYDGTIRPWLFEKDARPTEATVQGSLVVNDMSLVLDAMLRGLGVGYLAVEWIAQHVADGRLVTLLEDWSPTVSGFSLYYSSRRQVPAKLQAFIDFVRRRNHAGAWARLEALTTDRPSPRLLAGLDGPRPAV